MRVGSCSWSTCNTSGRCVSSSYTNHNPTLILARKRRASNIIIAPRALQGGDPSFDRFHAGTLEAHSSHKCSSVGEIAGQ
eukprot:4832093-Prymnesium_polylepis.1